MKPRRCALSLIEVTIVILVTGILAAVAAPMFANSLRVMNLEAAARQLAAHIDYVRSVAVNEGRTMSLICDNNLHTYASDSVEFPERIGELLNVSIPLQYDPTFTLVADFDSQTTLSFDLEGVPHVGAAALVDGSIVLASGDDAFAVIITAGTGVTRVERVDPGNPDPGGGGQQQESPPIDGQSGATL